MKFGHYEVNILDSGRFRLDGGAMFGVVPRVLWEKENPADEKNRIQMTFNVLLIRGEGRVILVDSGMGNKSDEKQKKIYQIDYSDHSLAKALEQYDIHPEQVTDVILTHLHFDHVGGTSYYDGDGSLKLQFPNATHYVQKRQMEWAQRRFEKDRASYLKENIEPLLKSDKMRLLQGPQKLFDNIEVITVEGHTPGQQMVLVGEKGNQLLFAADLIPMAAHVPVPWVMAYDLYPVTTIEEKKKYLEEAVEKNWLLVFEHDAAKQGGKIGRTDRGFEIKELVQL